VKKTLALLLIAASCRQESLPPSRSSAPPPPEEPAASAEPPSVPEEPPPPADPKPEASLIASYETRFSSSGNRAKNIGRALVGSVELAPGQTFSFNEFVGPRTSANGFLTAPVIFKGEMATGEGGGVCQVSTTLFAASRYAGLEIVERSPHSRPSSYVPPGMDSTVVWPGTDLKVRNPYPSAVRIAMSVSQSGTPGISVLKAEVWGFVSPSAPKYEGRAGKTREFKRVVRRPAHGPPGLVKKVQSGSNGIAVSSSLTWPDGRKASWRSEYAPVDEIWEVGEEVQDLDSWAPPQ
jgi:hypothetical protein